MTITHELGTERLTHTITSMDAVARSGFHAVSELARRALEDIEASGDMVRCPEGLADALNAIWCRAELVANDINAHADAVGCNYISAR